MTNGEGLGKGQVIDARTRSILFTSLLVILVLAILMHLRTSDTQSLLSLFTIAVIVFSNIIYFYNKSRKHTSSIPH